MMNKKLLFTIYLSKFNIKILCLGYFLILFLFVLLPNISFADITCYFGDGKGEVGMGYKYKGNKFFTHISSVPSFTVKNEKVYILDALNYRIHIFDYAGNYIYEVKYPDKGRSGKYSVMSDIAVGDNSMYLASNSEKIIYEIDIQGNILGTISGKETIILKNGDLLKKSTDNNKKGGFNYIDAIYINYSTNDLLIRDYDSDLIFVYKVIKEKLRLMNYIPMEYNFFFDSNHYFYPIEVIGKTVNIYSQKKNERKLIGKIESKVFIDKCSLIGIDKDNKLYFHFVENLGGTEGETELPGKAYIKVFSNTGKLLQEYPTIAWPGDAMTKFIVVDNDGFIFVAEIESKEKRLIIKKIN